MNPTILAGIRHAYEAFNQGDIQAAVDSVPLDPNILWSEPESFPGGGTYHGRQGVVEYLTQSRNGSEQAWSRPEEITPVGNQVFVLVHFKAWPKGGGEPREGYIADVYTVHDGKVVQMQAYADPAEARKALGLPY